MGFDRDCVSAYANKEIANRLIKETRRIPMWSNIYNRKFPSTNVKPRSSASVECEIKKVKNGVLKNKGKTMRVDLSVEKIVNYYDGKLRILGNEEDKNKKATDKLNQFN